MTNCRFAFRVNKVEMTLCLRTRRDASIEVVAIDSVVGSLFWTVPSYWKLGTSSWPLRCDLKSKAAAGRKSLFRTRSQCW